MKLLRNSIAKITFIHHARFSGDIPFGISDIYIVNEVSSSFDCS